MRTTVRLLTLWLAAGLLAVAAPDAAAQAIRAAALVPQLRGTDSTSELRNKFHDAVVRGLGTLNGPAGPNGELGELMTAQATRAHLGDELMGCGGGPACLSRAIAAVAVNRVVTTELTISGKTYAMSLHLYDGQGRDLTHADDSCEICTVHEAEESLTKAAARLAAVARSLPIEAPPQPRPIAPPPRVVDSTPPPGSTTAPLVDSTPTPTPVMVSERRHVPWKALAWTSVGVGLLGLAAGVPLLVIDGRPTCGGVDPTHNCPHVYNTTAGGAALVAVGALGLIASIPLFYFEWRDSHRMGALSLRGGALGSGTGLTLVGRF